MAHDESSCPSFPHELGDQLVDGGRIRRVELAAGLVGEQEPRSVDECRTDRDSLLLASGKRPRTLARTVAQAYPLEELDRLAVAHRSREPEQR